MPRGRQLEAGDHPQHGRLARAGRAEHREELAVGDLQVDTVDRGDGGFPGNTLRRPVSRMAAPCPRDSRRSIRDHILLGTGSGNKTYGPISRPFCDLSGPRWGRRGEGEVRVPWAPRPRSARPSARVAAAVFSPLEAGRAARPPSPAAYRRHPRSACCPTTAQLPSELELAERLGVSTVTVREALTSLREQGLVRTRRGRGGGSFVTAPDDAASSVLRARLRATSLPASCATSPTTTPR